MLICNCEECIFCKDKKCIIEVGDVAITIDKNGSCFNKSTKSNIEEDPCKKCSYEPKYSCTGCEERINYEKKNKKERNK